MKRTIRVGDRIKYIYGGRDFGTVLRLLPDEPPYRYPFVALWEHKAFEVTLYDNGDFMIISSFYDEFQERIKERLG